MGYDGMVVQSSKWASSLWFLAVTPAGLQPLPGFPLNHGPWSPYTNPLGKGGPARGPWQDFDEEISEEEVQKMQEDFPEVVDVQDEDAEDELQDVDEPVAHDMPVGHSGRTVVL